MNTPSQAPPRATPPATMRSKFHTPKPAGRPAEAEQLRVLTDMRRDKALIAVTLLTGVSLVGRLQSFDQYTLVLSPPNGGHEMLIFKSGILTVARKVQPPAAGATA